METDPTEIQFFVDKREILTASFHIAMLNTLLLGMSNLSIIEFDLPTALFNRHLLQYIYWVNVYIQ